MQALQDFLLPPAKSTMAHETDSIFMFAHIAGIILTIGILIAIIYFCYKYYRKSDDEVAAVIKKNRKLEVAWSVIPLIFTMVLFGWGYKTYLDIETPPANAYVIKVTGQQWLWRFTYPNGATSTGDLHVPANRPVKLLMNSEDVIHSFYVPDFRIKQDVVPGRYTRVWFNVKKPGESIIFCTEYCGTAHSNMTGKVIAHTPDEYQQWLEKQASGGSKPEDLEPAEWGQQLVQQNACTTCHSTDGSKMVGPTWKGVFNHDVQLSNGSTVTADEAYLRESILEPNAKIVNGYQPVMPAFKGQLNDEQINAIIEYLKTLK